MITNDSQGWTVESYRIHNEAMRAAEEKFQAERDRRYSEVATEREKALKIKEEADRAALGLAREIQTYKDEKANELREQINSERGLYATHAEVRAAIEKIEALVKPAIEYASAQRGTRAITAPMVATAIAAMGAIIGIIAAVVAFTRH